MLFLDGAYITVKRDVFPRRAKSPTLAEMEQLIHRISRRVGRYLERAGLLVRDIENSCLTLGTEDDAAMDDVIAYFQVSIARGVGTQPLERSSNAGSRRSRFNR